MFGPKYQTSIKCKGSVMAMFLTFVDWKLRPAYIIWVKVVISAKAINFWVCCKFVNVLSCVLFEVESITMVSLSYQFQGFSPDFSQNLPANHSTWEDEHYHSPQKNTNKLFRKNMIFYSKYYAGPRYMIIFILVSIRSCLSEKTGLNKLIHFKNAKVFKKLVHFFYHPRVRSNLL